MRIKADKSNSDDLRTSSNRELSSRSGEGAGDNPVHPFRIPIFRMLWIATLISNVGTWMQEVANSWLMTSLAPDPLMVSLVQVATALPLFMLGLPAGALADLVDRRRWLLGTQTWMMLSAAVMAAVTIGGYMTPTLLLFGSFLLSVGVALNSPGWHAVTPVIVPKESLQQAVTLNGVVINCARALGPALGGLVVVKMGPGAAFALNAISFVAVVFVLARWKHKTDEAEIPAERFRSALRVGAQHVRHSPLMRLLITRTSTLVFLTSAVWALLPLLCRQEYGFGARGYSLMLVGNAVGAIFGATFILPRLRRRMEANEIVTAAWVAFVPTVLVLSLASYPVLLACAMLWGGACNILMLSCFHLAAQSLAPEWVRARAVAVYLLSFSGATTFGAFFWGYLARDLGLRGSLQVAAIGLLLGGVTTWLAPVRTGENFDHEPTRDWEEHQLKVDIPLEHGPVMCIMRYEVNEEDSRDFLRAMERVKRVRYRLGVRKWRVFLDLENPRIYKEVFIHESWAAHLRAHERVSAYEQEVWQVISAFHRGSEAPSMEHLAICDESFPAGDKHHYFNSEEVPARVPLWFIG